MVDRECGRPGSGDTTTTLALSVCEFGDEFTCDSGHCIGIRGRCNNVDDCEDHSDEKDCTLVHIPETYTSLRPPESSGSKDPLDIVTQIGFINIDTVDYVRMRVGLTLEVRLRWHDKRLTFYNVAEDGHSRIHEPLYSAVWLPMKDIIHSNAIIGEIEKDENGYAAVSAVAAPLDGDPELSLIHI